jgi:hypothetical protein
VRRFYDDAEWVQLHDSPLGANVVTRESSSSVRIASTPNAPSVSQYPAGCRVRITHPSSSAVEANVVSASLSGPDLVVVIDSSSLVVGLNSIRRHISKSLRAAAFREVGASTGKIPAWDNLGSAAFLNTGHGNGLDADTLDGVHKSYFDALVVASTSRPNMLLNGGMQAWQRGATIDATLQYQAVDGGYTADGWKLLVASGAANVVRVERDTDAPAGFAHPMKITAVSPTAGPNSEKFGVYQVLERADCAPILGGTKFASLGFWAKTNVGSTLTRLRAAILAWNGAADAPSADPVSTWNPEGTDPALTAGGWTYENSPSLLTLTSSWQQFKIENVAIDHIGANNIAVFIWADDMSYVGGGAPDALFVTGVSLEEGTTVGAFRHESMAETIARAQRYFVKTFPYATRPQQNAGLTGAAIGKGGTAGNVSPAVFLPVAMPKTPTVVTYNPSAANSNWSNAIAASVTSAGDSGVAVTSGSQVTSEARIHVTIEAVL